MSTGEPKTQAERLAAARQHRLYVKDLGRPYLPGMQQARDWSGLAPAQRLRAVMVAEDWVADARAAGMIPYTTVVVMPDQVEALERFLGARISEASAAAPSGAASDGVSALGAIVYRSLGRLKAMMEHDPAQPGIGPLWKVLVDLAEGFERHPDYRPDTWAPKEGLDHVG